MVFDSGKTSSNHIVLPLNILIGNVPLNTQNQHPEIQAASAVSHTILPEYSSRNENQSPSSTDHNNQRQIEALPVFSEDYSKNGTHF